MFEYLQGWEQEVVERPFALHKARCIADLLGNSKSARCKESARFQDSKPGPFKDSNSAPSDDSEACLFESPQSSTLSGREPPCISRLPTYLQNRGENPLLPRVVLIDEGPMEGQGGVEGSREGRGLCVYEEERGEGRGVCEEERAGTLEFVVYDLAWDLYQELLQAIRA